MEDTASKQYLFHVGRYITFPQYDELLEDAIISDNRIAIYAKRLAFLSSLSTIRVVDFENPGRKTNYHVSNREDVSLFALNDHLLAVITYMG